MKKLNSLTKYIFIVLFLMGLYSVKGQTPENKSSSKLDQKIQAGFNELKAKNWKQSQTNFEDALKLFEKKSTASKLIFTRISFSVSEKTVITENGKPKDVSQEVDDFRRVFGTQQALLEFAAFSSQLAGNSNKSDQYLQKVDEMRGIMWEKSWFELIPKIHDLFYSNLTSENSENFGKYLLSSGQLLLKASDKNGINVIREAKSNLPKDPAIPAILASFLVFNGDPSNAKIEAESSLSLSPNQPSVLIDLATAEWLLNEIENSEKHAKAAKTLNPKLPGTYAALAFTSLEKDDFLTALKEAEEGNRLAEGHSFYKTILAAAYQANGEKEKARKLLSEAWGGDSPDEDQLKNWFFQGKPLEYIRQILAESK